MLRWDLLSCGSSSAHTEWQQWLTVEKSQSEAWTLGAEEMAAMGLVLLQEWV